MTQELHYNQIPIDFGFFTVKTFDNFIIGDNKKLYSSLQNIIDTDQLILIYTAINHQVKLISVRPCAIHTLIALR